MRGMIEARILALTLTFAALTLGIGDECMATERAQYAVVTSEAPFEIRDYAPSVIAGVTVNGSRDDAVSSGFRLLANYIFGNNQGKAKIAMTAPVTQMPASSAPAKPAAQNKASTGEWQVRFMMPAGYTLQSLPTPADQRIHLAQSPAHRAAVIRFSGFWSDANFKSHEADLRRWMQTQRLAPVSSPVFAYYDPPWTPWFMRTIEVSIDVAPVG